MKNLTLVLCCFLLSGNLVWGQIEKGAIALGGGLNTGYTWADGASYQGYFLEFNPSIAFMVSDHWLIGGTVGTFSFSEINVSDNSFIQPEVRYYFNPTAEKNKYYAALIPSFNLSDFDNSLVNFSFGFNRFLNENIALDANANYTVINNQQNIFAVNLGLRPFMSRTDRDAWKTAVSTFNRGDLLINTGFGSVSIIDDFIQLALNPSVGLFLSEQFLIGTQLVAGLSRNLDDNRTFQTSNLAIAPFARYYFGQEQQHWRWFGQAGFAYTGAQASIEDNFESSSSLFLLNSTWGVNWFLTSNVAFELGVNLDYNFGTNSETTFQGPLGQDFDGQLQNNGVSLGASIALQYFLNRSN